MWKKSADPPPPVGPPMTSSQAADAGRRFRRSPLLDEDEMSGLPSHAEGWSTLFDEFPRLLRDVRRNAHIRADAELRGIRAYDDADAGSGKIDTEAKRGAPYYSSRNLHRRDVVDPTTVDNVVPKVLQPGRNCKVLSPVFRIRIQRIHMFLGLPDPFVRGMGPGSFYHQAKIVRKSLDSYCFVTYFGLFPKCSSQVGKFEDFRYWCFCGTKCFYVYRRRTDRYVSYALFISLLISKLFCRQGCMGGGWGEYVI